MSLLRLLAALAVAATVLASCGDDGDAQGSTADPGGGPIACTEIGCTSGLFLDLSPIDRQLPQAEKVKLCIATKCRIFDPENTLAMMGFKGLKQRDTVMVRMVVLGEGGKTLRRSEIRAPVRRTQPNGPQCPPTCFQIAVRINPDSLKLVRT